MSDLRKGDVVLNGYAVAGFNDLHIIVGSTSRKTGPFSVTRYYETRCLFKGELLQSKSLFSKTDNKLAKIGHIDFDSWLEDQMRRAYDARTRLIKEGLIEGANSE